MNRVERPSFAVIAGIAVAVSSTYGLLQRDEMTKLVRDPGRGAEITDCGRYGRFAMGGDTPYLHVSDESKLDLLQELAVKNNILDAESIKSGETEYPGGDLADERGELACYVGQKLVLTASGANALASHETLWNPVQIDTLPDGFEWIDATSADN